MTSSRMRLAMSSREEILEQMVRELAVREVRTIHGFSFWMCRYCGMSHMEREEITHREGCRFTLALEGKEPETPEYATTGLEDF